MPSAPRNLRRCAEIFSIVDSNLLLYRCFLCQDWFGEHEDLANHLKTSCTQSISMSKFSEDINIGGQSPSLLDTDVYPDEDQQDFTLDEALKEETLSSICSDTAQQKQYDREHPVIHSAVSKKPIVNVDMADQQDALIIVQLQKLMEQVACVHVKLDLLQSKSNHKVEHEHVALKSEFPIKSHTELDEIEKIIQIDDDQKSCLIYTLQNIGGTDVNKHIRGCFAFLFEDEILHTFSFMGKSKRCFQKTALNVIILTSVRKHFPNLTDAQYKTYATEYIKHCKTRIHSRLHKMSHT